MTDALSDAAMTPRVNAGETTRAWAWTFAAGALVLPPLVILCWTLWQAPYPLSEAVSLFEDVAQRPVSSFIVPTTSYYRPLFYVALSTLWHGAGSVERALALIKVLLHILPLSALVVAFIAHLRPRSALDAAAALVATAVLIGSPGLLDNLELPLSYTLVGMPIAVIISMLLEHDPPSTIHHRPSRMWHGPLILALTIVAVGFKEQGLVVVPVIVLAWWMGAPGAGRGTVVQITILAVAYVIFRLAYRGAWPLFEQDVGFGFARLSSTEAAQRFGAFPLWIYAYSSLSTIANVLFAEPTDGTFRFVRAWVENQSQPWHFVYLLSSVATTTLIAWWGINVLRRSPRSPESRVVMALGISLLACGVLSFDYSRPRLGGMAVPFYALAAYHAIRWVARRAAVSRRVAAGLMTAALIVLATAWQARAAYTIEFTRQRSVSAHREWLTDLSRRRANFAGRDMYLQTMDAMTEQGTARRPIPRVRYPKWMLNLLGED
jgi:hypothetical protein